MRVVLVADHGVHRELLLQAGCGVHPRHPGGGAPAHGGTRHTSYVAYVLPACCLSSAGRSLWMLFVLLGGRSFFFFSSVCSCLAIYISGHSPTPASVLNVDVAFFLFRAGRKGRAETAYPFFFLGARVCKGSSITTAGVFWRFVYIRLRVRLAPLFSSAPCSRFSFRTRSTGRFLVTRFLKPVYISRCSQHTPPSLSRGPRV